MSKQGFIDRLRQPRIDQANTDAQESNEKAYFEWIDRLNRNLKLHFQDLVQTKCSASAPPVDPNDVLHKEKAVPLLIKTVLEAIEQFHQDKKEFYVKNAAGDLILNEGIIETQLKLYINAKVGNDDGQIKLDTGKYPVDDVAKDIISILKKAGENLMPPQPVEPSVPKKVGELYDASEYAEATIEVLRIVRDIRNEVGKVPVLNLFVGGKKREAAWITTLIVSTLGYMPTWVPILGANPSFPPLSIQQQKELDLNFREKVAEIKSKFPKMTKLEMDAWMEENVRSPDQARALYPVLKQLGYYEKK